ncbi:hypothetical protein ABE021_13180 [Sporosarcina gallistercoris]|uniref:hypothetical protein n=1 Tax=Sporosarcina gallistercoris TaxID=2762245 RepID=UPI003D2E2BDF
MKKILLVSALTCLLAGCTSNDPAQKSDTQDQSMSSLEENSINIPPDDHIEAEKQASENGADNSGLSTFEEYSKVAEVAPIEGLKGIVETDNSGTRVLLFEDESGQKTIKSIYVKKENRLKVISSDENDLLYNDILK